MEHINKIIFGGPRSGTKLLATVFQNHGYPNFGEFFNSFSCEIVYDNVPYAKRISKEEQSVISDTRKKSGAYYDDYRHGITVRDRAKLFNEFETITPSIVTIWEASFKLAPETFNLTDNRFVLCTRRNNRFEQLLSRSITKIHFNHDNDFKSTPVEINLNTFEFHFQSLVYTEKLQDQIVSSGKGKIVDFDKLIAGNADLGFSYNVTTQDQHQDLQTLVLNLDEVVTKFNKLKGWYGINW